MLEIAVRCSDIGSTCGYDKDDSQHNEHTEHNSR
jgi:predicted small metal-binding protein